MSYGPIIAFMVIMLFMYAGEGIAKLTKAYIPSVFITAVLFLIGYWTFLPKTAVTTASFGDSFVQICMALLLVHIGTLMDLRQLAKQWRAVVIALTGVAGTIILTLTIGSLLFNWQTVVAAVPPLTGGLVAALLMTQGLKVQGIAALMALPVSMFIMHSFFGYPITSYCLKKEGQRLAKKYRTGNITLNDADRIDLEKTNTDQSGSKKKWIPDVPVPFRTSSLVLFKTMLVGYLAIWAAGLMHGVINQYIICLIFGVIFCQLGFLERNSMVQAGVFNWLIYGLLAFVFSQLSVIQPNQLLSIILPIIVLIILGILGMLAASILLAKPLKLSRHMAFACSLTALFGFPADYIITTETCKSIGKDKDETAYLVSNMLPKMLVGGFATVSIASVIISSIFLKLL
ncbi:hypothetical protein [Sporolactobacillus putidus]|uniref:Na+/glutamate symporter n=1 Tax=Sporolactobacillus putidus TaxID=492735 RepID=A0A917S5Q0_9BACL|nr:hypothetical protein [Sporolactobacillus putidus]GGL56871.1 hypothetical protein GCM10007968_21060 [Sporolactobacillus putidus]